MNGAKDMQIVMVSNYLNHHQLPLCQAFLRRGAAFAFVATEALAGYRSEMGYADLNHSCPFVINAYESPAEKARALDACRRCDVLILGEWRIEYKRCVKPGCVVFVYSERIFKDSAYSVKNLLRYLKYLPTFRYSVRSYLLCAGAYTARDFRLLGQYRGRAYKWGYFPQVKPQDAPALLDKKDMRAIVWAGRFLDWKHPDTVIRMAERLKADGVPFSVTMIGDGDMRGELEAEISRKGLGSCVRLTGAMPPEAVRAQMERAGFYLFTSDRGEGWGAVLNEALNSCCVVFANEAAGSVPYLIRDGVNGYVYPDGDEDALYRRLRAAMDAPETQRPIALAANETMQSGWNADKAAERLLALSVALAAGKDTPFDSGVCSRA